MTFLYKHSCGGPGPTTGFGEPKGNRTQPVRIRLLLALALMAPAGAGFAAGPAPVNLGSTAHFAILTGAAITTTGGGVINGDVGASPIAGSAIGIPQAQVNGTIYEVDATGPAGAVTAPALLTAAKGDLTTAITDAANRTPVPSGSFLNPGSGNMGGMTLSPGLYKFTGTASIAGANLTLTGGSDDVWIFQIAADLEEESSRQIILAGGAQARNIYWQVGTSATIGTFAVFKGTILANAAIVMDTSSSAVGRLFSFSAGVTFNGTAGLLPAPAAPRFTRLSKTATNSATILLSTTPYSPVTLQSSPGLSPANWTTIATNYPTTSPWTFTDTNPAAAGSQNFYRAFITPP
jgi:hypothetical protein